MNSRTSIALMKFVLPIAMIVVGVVSFLLLDLTQPQIVLNVPTETAVVPSVESPQESPDKPIEDLDRVELLKHPYIPSQSVYASSYDKEALRLALEGNFDRAILRISGEVLDEGPHFVSISFDRFSGVYKSSRKSPNELDVEASAKMGGIFSRGQPIDISIDLKSEAVFAESRDSFTASGEPIRSITLLNEITIGTPTVVKLIAAPFNRLGRYGGARISSVAFEYSCVDGSRCGAALCSNQNLFTKCLTESFGRGAARDWCERTKVEGCEAYR